LPSDTTSETVVDRLDLRDSFSRWRFLQKLLDKETEASHANQVLYVLLKAFLEKPRHANAPFAEEQNKNESISPILNDRNRQLVESILDEQVQLVPVFCKDMSMATEHVLEVLEQLLPDPIENEDAHKGTWDIVMQLHGHESVKLEQTKMTPQWKAVSTVARIMIYFDFLQTDWYSYNRND
jgi:translation elongation factor EF-G